MEILSLILNFFVGIALISFITYLLIALQFRTNPIYYSFSFLSLATGIYILMTLLEYRTDSVRDYILFIRIQIISGIIFFSNMSWFLHSYTKVNMRKTLIAFNAFYLFFAILRIIFPIELTFIKIEGMTSVTVFNGETINVIVGDLNIWGKLFFSTVIGGYLLFLYIIIREAILQATTRSLMLFIVFSLFLVMIIADIIIMTYNIQSVYVSEFAFIFLISYMSFHLSDDMGKLKFLNERLENEKNFDKITGLPSKKIFLERLNVFLEQLGPSNSLAIIAFAIDNFQSILQTHGPQKGDELIKIVAKRICTIQAIKSSLSRIHGEEFAFFIHGFQKQEELASYIQQLQDKMLQPCSIDNTEIYVSISFGVYKIYPGESESDQILNKALSAMQIAKNSGRGQYQFFSDTITKIVSRRLNLENQLKRALLRDEIRVYYQPKINSSNGSLDGMEALVRWQTEDGKIIMPDNFISIAEETALIHEIGMIVLDQACSFTKKLNKEKGINIKVAVNISPLQLKESNFVDLIARILNVHNLDKANLELEITETQFVYEKSIIDKLNIINEFGISLTIDDFGTGYSNISYLENLPIQTLKIDKQYILGLDKNLKNQSLLKIFLQLANHFNLKTIAEGVETKKVMKIARKLGCNGLQGYFFSPPLPEEKFSDFIKH